MKVKDLRGFPKQRENLALTELGNRQALGFNQALDIVGELEIKVPKNKQRDYFLSMITHADKDLAEIQALAMSMGYEYAISDFQKEE